MNSGGKPMGSAAEAMIAGERREGKYDREKHAARLEIILARWDEILAILETLPAQEDVRALLRAAGAPTTPEALGVGDVGTAFLMTKDIRDKYIVSRLLWDLGELDEAADACFG